MSPTSCSSKHLLLYFNLISYLFFPWLTSILHNNSFSGYIPGALSNLLKLEVLDLGHNNLSGPFPHALLGIVSLKVVVLRNNSFIKDLSPELFDLNVISELQGDEETQASTKGYVVSGANMLRQKDNCSNAENPSTRKLLQSSIEKPRKRQRPHNRNIASSPSLSPTSSPSSSPIPSPSSSPTSSPPSKSQSPLLSPSPISHLPVDKAYEDSPHHSNSAPSPSPGTNQSYRPVYITLGAGVFAFFSFSSIYFICWRASKVETEPFKTGLSGKLQKALVMGEFISPFVLSMEQSTSLCFIRMLPVAGVQSLKRSELQAACEDFSNVIDTLSDCTLYKGTLSSGVEIAVTSSLIKTENDWSDQSESSFRNKASRKLSLQMQDKAAYRNLPETLRPQDTIFNLITFYIKLTQESLAVKEAEPLDWTARLRVAMGIAYCLDHLLRLDPPATLRALNSHTVYLTEDYAAKVTDLSFWNEEKVNIPSSRNADDAGSQLSNPEIVYKFGIILLELISGRLPFSKDDGLLVLWASSHLTGKRPLNGIVDQTVKSLTEEDISPLCKVVQSCVNPRPSERPKMADVAAELRKITGISPDAASPKLSPLWWAELEIIS
ncbi:putative LRR receptor-like serine/threonine-protein kinase MRH1 [Platanthera guangdongensis]|uniref:LRR receptor-like serine/threonine-protein kinase MRH1 n=1 Tax=Platanthera guangdongensis TaxID=2320717 RepID=A0ABR2LT07_9ASPA